MDTLFLQEIEATVVVHDLRFFSMLAAQLGPVDLGLILSRFYEHAASGIEPHGGRVVKFMGDSVLSVFIGAGGSDHCGKALEALRTTLSHQSDWLNENVNRKLPLLEYSMAAASGPVLVGDVGIPKMRRFDVLGEPVNTALRLVGVATDRQVSHLVTAATFEHAKSRPEGIEVDAVELGGKRVRLFRLEL